jgi:hypothetical protein
MCAGCLTARVSSCSQLRPDDHSRRTGIGAFAQTGSAEERALTTVSTFIEANETADLDLLMSTFDEDATIFIPGAPASRVSGKASIRQGIAELFKQRSGPIVIKELPRLARVPARECRMNHKRLVDGCAAFVLAAIGLGNGFQPGKPSPGLRRVVIGFSRPAPFVCGSAPRGANPRSRWHIPPGRVPQHYDVTIASRSFILPSVGISRHSP